MLLGYSYGGCVVTGALEFVWDRVSHLVYLDAFVPFNGQSIDDMLGVTRPAFGLGEPWLVPPIPRTYEVRRRGNSPRRDEAVSRSDASSSRSASSARSRSLRSPAPTSKRLESRDQRRRIPSGRSLTE